MPKEAKSPRNYTDPPAPPSVRQKGWAVWPDKNCATSFGVWLKLAKKASGIQSMTYDFESRKSCLCS
jgi:uncharacterized protein YdeI (YjbR/CyaY-like superfamily)